VKEFYKPTCRI